MISEGEKKVKSLVNKVSGGTSTLTPACGLLFVVCLATAAPCSALDIAQLEPPFCYCYYLFLTMTRKNTRNETKVIKRMYRKR